MDLEGLRQEIKNELQRLDQRRTVLMEQLRNMSAVEDLGTKVLKETVQEGRPAATSSSGLLKENPQLQTGLADFEVMLEALRCLKCGSSLRIPIPTDADGEPEFGSPRLGRSEGGDRFLECPHCYAKNIFVRTTGPSGWRLLVTQLKQ